VSLGDFSFLAAGGGFGYSSGLRSACGFDALGGCGSRCLFRLTKRAFARRVWLFRLMGKGGLSSLMGSRFCGNSGGFCLGLGEKGLFAHLLGSSVPQLSAVLTA
jgi:hypothetical protein